MRYEVCTDASVDNNSNAGMAFIITTDKRYIIQKGFRTSNVVSNSAEMIAVGLACTWCRKNLDLSKDDHIEICVDNETVVEQLCGESTNLENYRDKRIKVSLKEFKELQDITDVIVRKAHAHSFTAYSNTNKVADKLSKCYLKLSGRV